MKYKILKYMAFFGLLHFISFFPSSSIACGHEGVYLGAGYSQLFMFTNAIQNNRFGSGAKVKFGPGYGGHFVAGYDFPGSRWGIQIPFEINRLKLNQSEWVNFIDLAVEGVFHIIEWKNGIDFHLVGGAGWSYLTDGSVDNNSQTSGISASFGPGFSYYFARTEKVSASLTLDAPFRFIRFFGDNLSRGGASVFAFPIRIGMQVGF